MNQPEDITLKVRSRYSCGAHVCRCNGKVASHTGNEIFAVERAADKAIKAVAETLRDPALARRPKRATSLGGGVWTVTYIAPSNSCIKSQCATGHCNCEGCIADRRVE